MSSSSPYNISEHSKASKSTPMYSYSQETPHSVTQTQTILGLIDPSVHKEDDYACKEEEHCSTTNNGDDLLLPTPPSIQCNSTVYSAVPHEFMSSTPRCNIVHTTTTTSSSNSDSINNTTRSIIKE